MDLNRSKWYVRWYFWSLGILDAFWDRGNTAWQKEKAGTNLCAFMRLILLYAPLIILFTVAVYATALASVIVVPIWFFGLIGYGICLGVIAVLILIVVLGNKFLDKWAARESPQKEQTDKPTNTNAATDPSFPRIVGRWIVAKKQKFCPLITFVKDNKEVQP